MLAGSHLYLGVSSCFLLVAFLERAHKQHQKILDNIDENNDDSY